MTLESFSGELKKTPLTSGFAEQINILRDRYGDEYVHLAETVLALFEDMGFDAVKAARKYIYDYLQQLDYFLKHGNYGHADYSTVKKQIYDDKDTMLKTYMPGLLLSYAYTTILYEKNHLFLNVFLPQIHGKYKGVEVGFGEGFYLWELLDNKKEIEMAGYDISPYALEFARSFLSKAGIESDRYALDRGNVFEGIPVDSNSMDFAVFAEVIEHIPNPEIGLHEVVRMLRVGGILYLTTVIDSNHMDHISNFESPEVVERMLAEEGMTIIDKNIYHMKDDFPDSADISVGLAFVAKKDG